jgi:hypothetical protein
VYVPDNCQKIPLVFNWHGLIPAFKNVAGPTPLTVVIPAEAGIQTVHYFAQGFFIRTDGQVEMIVHYYISKNFQAVHINGVPQLLKQVLLMLRHNKYKLPVVTPLDYVVHCALKLDSWSPTQKIHPLPPIVTGAPQPFNNKLIS